MTLSRAVLQKRIDRLERKIGGDIARGTAFSAWGDDTDILKRNAAGAGQIRHAIVIGRRALESGDEQQIKEAVALCENLEDYAQSRAKRNGGRTRGDDQTRAADAKWQPWVIAFGELTASGMTDRLARVEVKQRMMHAPTADWPTKEFPSDKTLRERLRSEK